MANSKEVYYITIFQEVGFVNFKKKIALHISKGVRSMPTFKKIYLH